MLRIALWKLRATCSVRAHRWRANEPLVYYFAYGANLHPKVMKRRGIGVHAEEAFELKGHRLSFAQPGPWKNCAFATVEADPSSVVWGKLYLISASDARRLEYEELVVVFGRHRTLELEQGGRRFFLFQSVHPRPGLKPTAVYRDLLVDGLKGYPGVPSAYVEQLQRTETATAGEISDDSGYLVRDIEKFPRAAQPVLRRYERLGAWVLSKL